MMSYTVFASSDELSDAQPPTPTLTRELPSEDGINTNILEPARIAGYTIPDLQPQPIDDRIINDSNPGFMKLLQNNAVRIIADFAGLSVVFRPVLNWYCDTASLVNTYCLERAGYGTGSKEKQLTNLFPTFSKVAQISIVMGLALNNSDFYTVDDSGQRTYTLYNIPPIAACLVGYIAFDYGNFLFGKEILESPKELVIPKMQLGMFIGVTGLTILASKFAKYQYKTNGTYFREQFNWLFNNN